MMLSLPCSCCCDCAVVNIADMNVVSGSFVQAGGSMTTTSTNAVALGKCPVSTGANEDFAVTTQIRGTNAGDKIRLYFAYLDSDNWRCVEVVCGSLVRVIEKLAGVETELWTRTTELADIPMLSGTPLDIYVHHLLSRGECRVRFSRGVHNINQEAVVPISGAIGAKFGIGTGDTVSTTVRFNSVVVDNYETLDADCQVPFDCRIYDVNSDEIDIDTPAANFHLCRWENGTPNNSVYVLLTGGFSVSTAIVFDYLDSSNFHEVFYEAPFALDGTPTVVSVRKMTAGVYALVASITPRAYGGIYSVCVSNDGSGVVFGPTDQSFSTTLHGGKFAGYRSTLGPSLGFLYEYRDDPADPDETRAACGECS